MAEAKGIYTHRRRALIVVLDACLLALCYYFAFFLRLDKFVFGNFAGIFLKTLPIAVVLEMAGMYFAGVYRGIWRYASMNDLANIFKGTAYGTVTFVLSVVFFFGTQGFPRSVFLINAGLVILGIGGARFVRRFQFEVLFKENVSDQGKAIIIVGAGDAADDLIRELHQNPAVGFYPVGIVDDDPGKKGREIHGVSILGKIKDLPRLAKEKSVEEILIAIPSATGVVMRGIVEVCREAEVPFRTVPGVGDILDGRVHVSQLRKVNVEDLLRRPPVKLDRQAIGGFLSGKKVLVTGAGGSIGSELCRQVARFGPAELIMLDHSENGLFYLDEEFTRSFGGTRHRQVVADVTNAGHIRGIFGKAKPEVVFHAAAHKHVTLMEDNFRAAFFNNVTGTRVVAEAAAECGAEKFVMISTDKAVNPTNIMGLSKRMAELVVRGMNPGAGQGERKTDFISVRFGNVMGSEGSVIPLWYRQIRAGGPVTVTHPEVTRYFMTIPEAVQLVLQASSMGKSGEIFVLEMGEPMKALDVARQVITLSGKEPDVDIEIKFIGLRPGEKLYEELITQCEGVVATGHAGIMVLRPEREGLGDGVGEKLRRLEGMVAESDGARAIMAVARELVPEYEKTDHGLRTVDD